jgi:hypothetical protein
MSSAALATAGPSRCRPTPAASAPGPTPTTSPAWLARAIPASAARLRGVERAGREIGILAELGPKAKLAALEPRDPESAGRVIEAQID